jgi:hypothetical protein
MKRAFIATITKSVGGRGGGRKWTNRYPYEVDADIDDPIHTAVIERIVGAERGIHYNVVDFLGAHIARYAHTPTEFGVNGAFVSIALEGTGARVPTTVLMPSEAVLRVFRSARTDRPGAMSYRGCLSFDDIERTPLGDYVLKRTGAPNAQGYRPLPQWIVDFKNTLSGPLPGGAEFVMLDKSLNPADYSRTVIGWDGGEVAFRQTTSKRRSPEQALYEGARSEVNFIERRVKSLVQGFPAAFTDPAYLPTLSALGGRVKEILEALPPEKRVKLVLEKASRDILALNAAT